MIGHFTNDERVLEYINSNDLEKLAPMGTSCPDHFLRTKIPSLVLDLTTAEDVTNRENIKQKLQPQFEDYRKMYAHYYNKNKHANSPAMRDANPVIILYPGVGMFSFAKDKQTPRVAAEIYGSGGEPKNLEEKMEDIGLLHSLNQSSGAISLHIPWDIPENAAKTKALAAQYDLLPYLGHV